MSTNDHEDARAEAVGKQYADEWAPTLGTMGTVARAFVAGTKWQAEQEPTDAECIAILNAVTTPFGEKVQTHEWAYAGIQRCREAIMEARRKEYK